MKNVVKILMLVTFSVVFFAFIPIKADEPKVVIIDIVNNLDTEKETSVVDKLMDKIAELDKNNVKVLMWKELTQDKTQDPVAILSQVNPDYVLTVSFKNASATKDNITAVVSKTNLQKKQSILLATDIAKSLESENIENKGVFETESKYPQDNNVPAVFLSVEVKNEPSVDDELASKLINVIETVNVKDLEAIEPSEEAEEAQDTIEKPESGIEVSQKAQEIKNKVQQKQTSFKQQASGI
ncbi:hypothetical protein [Weeksella sp. HMSC059D05]|uniref:hypothetical protein n=1 Tax=Weeksella sp. HMSC059D05 TaxID=1715139 RepID=UPI0008A610B0|nr:hypothetical protein [Weeksella sp. HMSC059D05]OFM84224.1 hypothetical protein HMPREF2660_09430 [Weeksella sp. HMSC059D05]